MQPFFSSFFKKIIIIIIYGSRNLTKKIGTEPILGSSKLQLKKHEGSKEKKGQGSYTNFGGNIRIRKLVNKRNWQQSNFQRFFRF